MYKDWAHERCYISAYLKMDGESWCTSSHEDWCCPLTFECHFTRSYSHTFLCQVKFPHCKKERGVTIVFGFCIAKKKNTFKASLLNIKLVVWSPKSGVITERSNRAKAANANTQSHSGLLWGRGSVEGWGPLIINPVSSLRHQMIKTYLPASNAALLPQKMLQSWICKGKEPFSLLVK